MFKTLLLLILLLLISVQAYDKPWGKYENQLAAPLIVPEFSNGRSICPCYIVTPTVTPSPTPPMGIPG
jgi:hypothetical protein